MVGNLFFEPPIEDDETQLEMVKQILINSKKGKRKEKDIDVLKGFLSKNKFISQYNNEYNGEIID